MRKNVRALLTTAVIILAACNKTDNIDLTLQMPGGESTVIITATTGGDQGTRISYEESTDTDGDTWTNILWDASEQFSLCYNGGDAGTSFVFEKDENSGTGLASADFSYSGNTLPVTPPAEILYAVYAGSEAVNAAAAGVTVDFTTQDGKATGKHLMVGALDNKESALTDWSEVGFSFKSRVALLKLTLSNTAFANQNLTNIVLSGDNLCSQGTYNLTDGSWTANQLGGIVISGPVAADADGKVTLYIAQPISGTATGLITISAASGNEVYTGTLPSGTFTAYSVYTAGVGMAALRSMKFTVKPTSTQYTFTLPFTDAAASGYNLTVDWGDGSALSTYTGGNTYPSHTYAGTNSRTITLTTTAPSSGAQMPRFFFGASSIAPMLISMDSPMLNTGNTSFLSCFYGCTNLTTISTGLFAANTAASNFSHCFRGCASLTTVPAGLFTANTAITSFSGCFRDCTGFTTIPKGLFDTNAAVGTFDNCFANCISLTAVPAKLFNNIAQANFSFCFSGCTYLKLNSNIFCDEAKDSGTHFAGKSMDIRYCFYNVGSALTTNQGGVAPTLWTYGGTFTSGSCFTGCTNVTNAGAIPSAWK